MDWWQTPAVADGEPDPLTRPRVEGARSTGRPPASPARGGRASSQASTGRGPAGPVPARLARLPLAPSQRAVPGGDPRDRGAPAPVGDHRRRAAGRRGRLRGPGGGPVGRRRARSLLRPRIPGQLQLPLLPAGRGGRLPALRRLRRRGAHWWRSASASATVLVCFELGRTLYWAHVGLLAALFFALSGYGVLLGRLALLDSTLVFLFSLARCVLREVADDRPGSLAVRVRGRPGADDPGQGDRRAGARDRGELPAGLAPARPAQRAPRACSPALTFTVFFIPVMVQLALKSRPAARVPGRQR